MITKQLKTVYISGLILFLVAGFTFEMAPPLLGFVLPFVLANAVCCAALHVKAALIKS